jgi:hypothetical protein
MPIVIGAAFADSWLMKAVLLVLWLAGVGAVTAFVLSDVRYSRELVRRIEATAPPRPPPPTRRSGGPQP